MKEYLLVFNVSRIVTKGIFYGAFFKKTEVIFVSSVINEIECHEDESMELRIMKESKKALRKVVPERRLGFFMSVDHNVQLHQIVPLF